MRRTRLPLRGIAVFESVARLGSFKAAAIEHNLSASAVSHQIRSLEQHLNVVLFERASRGISLTGDAAEYAKILHVLMDRMHMETAKIARRINDENSQAVVRVMTPPTLATHWLMPRLPTFLEAHPAIDIRFAAINTGYADEHEFDIFVGYGDAARWKGRAQPLLEETIQPYCSPSLLGDAKSLTLNMLPSLPLIRSRYNDVSWEFWLGQRGIYLDTPSNQQIQIDPSYVAIEAAVKGIGVILESSLLTQEHVHAGRLIAPLQDVGAAFTSYWLLPLRRGATAATVAVFDWLMEQANVSRSR